MTSNPNQDRSPTDFDQGFKSNNRPQSTIALSFASDLDSAFSLSPSLDNLNQSIFDKQSTLTSQNRELEALEARLRETEERLKRSRASSPAAGATLGRQRNKDREAEGEGDRRNGKSPLASPRGPATTSGVDTKEERQQRQAESPSNSRPPSRKIWSRGRSDAPASRGSER